MSLDFNDTGQQKNLDIMPDGSIATVQLKIRPGNVGEGGWLKRSKKGDSEALDCELLVLDGPFAKRKFWSLMTVGGTSDGHAQAADISNRRLRAALESARGVRPDDNSDVAKAARRVASYGDFEGLCFIARIGVEPPQNGFKAKNTLDRVITPDEKAWHAVTQQPKPTAAAMPAPAQPTSAPARLERPTWAKD
jgi:hypothetical protein